MVQNDGQSKNLCIVGVTLNPFEPELSPEMAFFASDIEYDLAIFALFLTQPTKSTGIGCKV